MIHKLLCKLGIHKYEERVYVNFYCSRKITGTSDIYKERIKDFELFYKCRYCGKRKEVE